MLDEILRDSSATSVAQAHTDNVRIEASTDTPVSFEAALERAAITGIQQLDTGITALANKSGNHFALSESNPQNRLLSSRSITWEELNQSQQLSLQRQDSSFSSRITENGADQRNILKALEDGKVDSKEFTGIFDTEELSNSEKELIFDRFDTDRNGELSPEEFEAAMEYIVELLKRKKELKEEANRERAQQSLSTRNNLGAIGSEGEFINDLFTPPPASNTRSKRDSLDHAFAPIQNSIQLASWELAEASRNN